MIEDNSSSSDPFFDKYVQLAEEKDSQYEIEAHEIIKLGKLSKQIGKLKITFQVNGDEKSFEIVDPAKPEEVLAGNYGPAGKNEAELLFELKSYLAQSEAIALSLI